MTRTIIRTELAHRASDGIDVYLFWNEPTSRVTVDVVDGRADGSFELEVDGRHALDAFNHPYAYAARESQEATVTTWRNDHARTNR
jgi:hypothetical protein